jgi:hypothetical protein
MQHGLVARPREFAEYGRHMHEMESLGPSWRDQFKNALKPNPRQQSSATAPAATIVEIENMENEITAYMKKNKIGRQISSHTQHTDHPDSVMFKSTRKFPNYADLKNDVDHLIQLYPDRDIRKWLPENEGFRFTLWIGSKYPHEFYRFSDLKAFLA